MDWPLAGIATGIAVFTGAAAYGIVSYIESDPPPKHLAVAKSAEPALVPRSALPVYVAPSELNDSTPLIDLSRPQAPFVFEKPHEIPPSQPIPPPVKAKHPPPASAIDNTAMVVPPHVHQAVRWRVVPTANANYFNLGGHIDNAGTVDSVASEHLREAFKAHRNFNKLPPDIKTHILTQNISLPKIAPYRGLLGINDKRIEQEQAIRFERVGDIRSSGLLQR